VKATVEARYCLLMRAPQKTCRSKANLRQRREACGGFVTAQEIFCVSIRLNVIVFEHEEAVVQMCCISNHVTAPKASHGEERLA
jgi:hypothetical protein